MLSGWHQIITIVAISLRIVYGQQSTSLKRPLRFDILNQNFYLLMQQMIRLLICIAILPLFCIDFDFAQRYLIPYYFFVSAIIKFFVICRYVETVNLLSFLMNGYIYGKRRVQEPINVLQIMITRSCKTLTLTTVQATLVLILRKKLISRMFF